MMMLVVVTDKHDQARRQVSGTVDGVFQMGSEGQNRRKKLAGAEASALAKAVQAGADPSTCKVSKMRLIPCTVCFHAGLVALCLCCL